MGSHVTLPKTSKLGMDLTRQWLKSLHWIQEYLCADIAVSRLQNELFLKPNGVTCHFALILLLKI